MFKYDILGKKQSDIGMGGLVEINKYKYSYLFVCVFYISSCRITKQKA